MLERKSQGSCWPHIKNFFKGKIAQHRPAAQLPSILPNSSYLIEDFISFLVPSLRMVHITESFLILPFPFWQIILCRGSVGASGSDRPSLLWSFNPWKRLSLDSFKGQDQVECCTISRMVLNQVRRPKVHLQLRVSLFIGETCQCSCFYIICLCSWPNSLIPSLSIRTEKKTECWLGFKFTLWYV